MWLERKYTTLLSTRLERFKLRGNVASFRCNMCGDSKTNKFKTRGTIILQATGSYFYCHNCHRTFGFAYYLKLTDPLMWEDYNRELLGEKLGIVKPLDDGEFTTKTEFKPIDEKLRAIKCISQLKPDHPARLYIDSRLIPTKQHYRLRYAPKFKEWVNSIIPGKFENVDKDEPRLILPFISSGGVFFGFQGRSFRKNIDPAFRYITIMADPNRPKVFGLDAIDLSKPLRVVEGPIDSFFLSNCIATAGGKLQSELERIDGIDKSKTTIIYDNEPRNATVVSNIEQAIRDGYNVVIWPNTEVHKDLNEMILNGRNDLDAYIDAHTYCAARAKLELTRWRRA